MRGALFDAYIVQQFTTNTKNKSLHTHFAEYNKTFLNSTNQFESICGGDEL